MNLFNKIRTQLRDYFVWRNAVVFVSGLVLGHNIVEKAVVNIIMAYLQSDEEKGTLRRSAIIVNAQQGLTSVLAILMAYLANTCGPFTTISVFTVPYILGFVVMWVLNPGSSGLYFIAATLIAIGGSTKESTLRKFLSHQMSDNNQSSSNINDDQELVERRTFLWWQIPRIIASVIASFVLAKLRWKVNFLISAITLGCAWLFFLSGFKYYQPVERQNRTTNPFVPIFGVIKAAITKRKLRYSDEPRDYFRNDNINHRIPLTPDVFFSRWLDKAAIINRASSLSVEEQVRQGTLYTVTQVKEVKSLMKMVPLWAVFMQFSLLKATGNTFFYEQSQDLEFKINNNFEVPIIFLNLTQSFSSFVTSSISNLIISNCFSVDKNRNHHLFAMKVRIGIGLACSSLCCFVARLVEIKRSKNYITDQEGIIIGNRMSILWLFPEFCLLGISEGLTEEGVDELFYYRTETLKDYVWPLNELVCGIGYFISILWVLSFKKWIGISIYHSRFDLYYGVLAIVSLINLFIIFGFAVFSKHCCHGDSATRRGGQVDEVGEESTTIS